MLITLSNRTIYEITDSEYIELNNCKSFSEFVDCLDKLGLVVVSKEYLLREEDDLK